MTPTEIKEKLKDLRKHREDVIRNFNYTFGAIEGQIAAYENLLNETPTPTPTPTLSIHKPDKPKTKTKTESKL